MTSPKNLPWCARGAMVALRAERVLVEVALGRVVHLENVRHMHVFGAHEGKDRSVLLFVTSDMDMRIP